MPGGALSCPSTSRRSKHITAQGLGGRGAASACWPAKLLRLDSEKEPWRDSGSVPAEPIAMPWARKWTFASILQHRIMLRETGDLRRDANRSVRENIRSYCRRSGCASPGPVTLQVQRARASSPVSQPPWARPCARAPVSTPSRTGAAGPGRACSPRPRTPWRNAESTSRWRSSWR